MDAYENTALGYDGACQVVEAEDGFYQWLDESGASVSHTINYTTKYRISRAAVLTVPPPATASPNPREPQIMMGPHARFPLTTPPPVPTISQMDAHAGEVAIWKKCSTCKRDIAFKAMHYVCSVSTCNSKRLGLVFCSVGCWDAHLGFARHRDASAVEVCAPNLEPVESAVGGGLRALMQGWEEFAALASAPEGGAPIERKPRMQTETSPMDHDQMEPGSDTGTHSTGARPETETLVVISKVKKLIKDKGGINTSQCCIDALTTHLVDVVCKGIEHAKADGRKTLMGRDIA